MQPNPGAKLSARNLNLYYGSFHALKDVNLDVQPRSITAIIGPSGCGKSTLLRTFNRMNDLVQGARVEGEVTLDGQNIYAKETSLVTLRKRVGMVFQRPNPFPFSVRENVLFGPHAHGIVGRDRLEELLERSLKAAGLWDQVADKLDTPALELSLGEQQQLCIARLLAVEPEVIQKRVVQLNQSLKRTISLEKGLDNAQKCVMRFLPSKEPEIEGYEFGFLYRSSEKVGGDFFDFVPLDGDHLGLIIGDVSGHGLDAAILMGICKKVLNLRAKEAGRGSPREVLLRAHRDLAPDFHRCSFVTALYGILELPTGRFTFCRAGHEPPIVFGPDIPPRPIESRGAILGAKIHQGDELEDKSVEVPPGGYVLLYTDGLPELMDSRGAVYTRDRLLFSLGQVTPELSCREALNAILRSAQGFAEGEPQADDITTILFCRRESER